jgi:gamma-glutamyltranspeptidase / glutathione hydrolase
VFREREQSPISAAELTPSDLNRLLSEKHASEIAEGICGQDSVTVVPESGDGPGDTTHLTVADRHGNVVALTQSIQSVFGAKVAHPALGFVYNNYLRTCPRDPHPYQLNPHCMPRSNAAPTLVLRNTSSGIAPVLALGAAGSRRITSSILQVISNVLDRGQDVADAVAAPRAHALLSGKVWIEQPAASQQLLPRLERRFSEVRIRSPHDYAMGCVQALQWLPDGTVLGAADPRRDGVAAILR